MTQYTMIPIDVDVIDGNALATNLNREFSAIRSRDSGSSRPAYMQEGGIYVNTASTVYKLALYDGQNEIVLGEVDTTANLPRLLVDPDSNSYVVSGGDDKINFVMGGTVRATISDDGIFVGGSTAARVTFDTTNTDAFRLPSGTTAQRPTGTSFGLFRFNETRSTVEYQSGVEESEWTELAFSVTRNFESEVLTELRSIIRVGGDLAVRSINVNGKTRVELSQRRRYGIQHGIHGNLGGRSGPPNGFATSVLPAGTSFVQIEYVGVNFDMPHPGGRTDARIFMRTIDLDAREGMSISSLTYGLRFDTPISQPNPDPHAFSTHVEASSTTKDGALWPITDERVATGIVRFTRLEGNLWVFQGTLTVRQTGRETLFFRPDQYTTTIWGMQNLNGALTQIGMVGNQVGRFPSSSDAQMAGYVQVTAW